MDLTKQADQRLVLNALLVERALQSLGYPTKTQQLRLTVARSILREAELEATTQSLDL